MRSVVRLVPLCAVVLLGVSGCVSPYGRPGKAVSLKGDEIVVCGELYHTGAPVVRFLEPDSYDAYRAHCHFKPEQAMPSRPVSDEPVRFGSWRRHLPDDVAASVREHGWTLPELQEQVDQFVLHYDACGTSRQCFRVLQDIRGLSVHFMLDLDGTIYQTLDVKERAWHAGTANDRSVGVEIANIGAYPDMSVLKKWYSKDENGHTLITIPESLGESGLRRVGYVPRPAHDDVITGEVNGRTLYQYDLTDAQYDSLIKLAATLCRVLPKIRPDFPRDENGEVKQSVLTDEEMANFSGILGHLHVTSGKVDPGPAFDWARLEKGLNRNLRQPWPFGG